MLFVNVTLRFLQFFLDRAFPFGVKKTVLLQFNFGNANSQPATRCFSGHDYVVESF